MKVILITKDSALPKAETIVQNFLEDRAENPLTIYISPQKEKNKVKEEYSIEQIKNISANFFRKDENKNEKYFIVTQAQKIPQLSQNAFLKTLEDSTGNILLLVDNIENLLNTIRSRCEIYKVDSNNEQEETKNLDDLSLENLSSYAKLDRESLKQYLINKSQTLKDMNLVVLYDVAIKKLNANCKAEAVLLEIISKSSR